MRMPSDKEANAPVFTIGPTFGEMAVQMGEATWSIPELSQREKVLICIAADVCTRDIELPLEMHVQMALANEVPLSDVREAILQSAVEAGHTATLLALKKFKEVCQKLSADERGDSQQLQTSPSFEYFSNARFQDHGLTAMWKPIMDKRWSRSGLSVKERAYISLTANVLRASWTNHSDTTFRSPAITMRASTNLELCADSFQNSAFPGRCRRSPPFLLRRDEALAAETEQKFLCKIRRDDLNAANSRRPRNASSIEKSLEVSFEEAFELGRTRKT